MNYLNLKQFQDTYPDEGEYIGSFRHDKREGKGTIKWSDGSEFEGIWKND